MEKEDKGAYKCYKHLVTNLAFNSNETCKEKLSITSNWQYNIVIQVHVKLHDFFFFISTYVFHWNYKSSWND